MSAPYRVSDASGSSSGSDSEFSAEERRFAARIVQQAIRHYSPDRSNRSPEQLRETNNYLGDVRDALQQSLRQPRPDRRGERGSSPLGSLVADRVRRVRPRRRGPSDSGAATARDQPPASAAGRAAAGAGPPSGAPPPSSRTQQQWQSGRQGWVVLFSFGFEHDLCWKYYFIFIVPVCKI